VNPNTIYLVENREVKMNDQSIKNKRAWEYRAYEFWNKNNGPPLEKAEEILKDPKKSLKIHQRYFEEIEGKKIANLCGSNGRKAVPLALMGAKVTVFDISEENRRYALELAECAQTSIDYVVCDLYDINLAVYNKWFDILYLEGGILHYFNDINKLMNILYRILKPTGRMVLSDFHPIRKIAGKGNYKAGASNRDSTGETVFNYFDTEMHLGDVAYKQFFSEEEKQEFPDVLIRSYTLSDIINAVIEAGFSIKRFEEHPDWVNKNIPGEFTVLAVK
jgi:SAM-dependent methyltransferase